jgi:hypothetical protein
MYQFLHLGAYGRAPRKREPAWSCISGITAEGARVPGARGHIRYPAEPRLLFGISPIDAGREAAARADCAVDAAGRRLRMDGVALIAGVVSYPDEKEAVDAMIGNSDYYRLWKYTVVDWLEAGFGEHLRSVVEHVDERFYHLHFYCVPPLGADGRLRVDVIHPGRRAKAEAAALGACKRDQDRAYRQGMRAFQDRFHAEVSRDFGHQRVGPQRQRLARQEQLLQRKAEEERKRLREEADHELTVAQSKARAEAHDRYGRRMSELEACYRDEIGRRCAAEAEVALLREALLAAQISNPAP